MTLDEKELELIADKIADIVMKRLAVRERAVKGGRGADIQYFTYAETAQKIGKSVESVKKLVQRKQLRATHPMGGRSALIDSRDLEAYLGR